MGNTVLEPIPQFGINEGETIVPVEATSDEHELVSLTEVYEKTGMESYDAIIRTVVSYNRNKKIDKHGCTVLNVAGVESMIPGFDRYNTVMGGENFIVALRDGFINLVKTVIKYVGMAFNWVWHNLAVMVGLERSEKEQKIIDDLHDEIAGGISNLGVAVAVEYGLDANMFKPDLIAASIPKGVTSLQALNMIMGRFSGSMDEMVARLANNCEALNKLDHSFADVVKSNLKAIDQYKRHLNAFKGKFRQGGMSELDLESFALGMKEIMANNFDLSGAYNELTKILADIYDIQTAAPEVQEYITKASEKAMNSLKPIRVSIDESMVVKVRNEGTKLAIKAGELFKNKLDQKSITELKGAINENDANFIKEVDDKYPEFKLIPLYLEFTGKTKSFSKLISDMSKVIKGIKGDVTGIVEYSNKIKALTNMEIAGAYDDICTFADKALGLVKGSPDGVLTRDQLKGLLSASFKNRRAFECVDPDQGHAVMVDIENIIFNRMNTVEGWSKVAKAVVRVNAASKEVKETVNNFLRSCGINKRV